MLTLSLPLSCDSSPPHPLYLFHWHPAASSDLTCFKSHNSTCASFLSTFLDFSRDNSLTVFPLFLSSSPHSAQITIPCYSMLSMAVKFSAQKQDITKPKSSQVISGAQTPPLSVTKDVIASMSVPLPCNKSGVLIFYSDPFLYIAFRPLILLVSKMQHFLSFHQPYYRPHSACVYFRASLLQYPLFCVQFVLKISTFLGHCMGCASLYLLLPACSLLCHIYPDMLGFVSQAIAVCIPYPSPAIPKSPKHVQLQPSTPPQLPGCVGCVVSAPTPSLYTGAPGHAGNSQMLQTCEQLLLLLLKIKLALGEFGRFSRFSHVWKQKTGC